ncbi:hypothetical protein HK101_005179 [Irineochytrium annulatum]|nr:hypothetical protein HK101_005179 [Irineochytrium annulatum]
MLTSYSRVKFSTDFTDSRADERISAENIGGTYVGAVEYGEHVRAKKYGGHEESGAKRPDHNSSNSRYIAISYGLNVPSPPSTVVEIMCLVVCDKVIYQKVKYMLAMDMTKAAYAQLQLPATSPKSADGKPDEPVPVTLETEDGEQVAEIVQFKAFDKSVDEIERTLVRQVSVFGQLLRRYGLLDGTFPVSNTEYGLGGKQSDTLKEWRAI